MADPVSIPTGTGVVIYNVADGMPDAVGVFFHCHKDIKQSCIFDFIRDNFYRIENDLHRFEVISRDAVVLSSIGLRADEGTKLDLMTTAALKGEPVTPEQWGALEFEEYRLRLSLGRRTYDQMVSLMVGTPEPVGVN